MANEGMNRGSTNTGASVSPVSRSAIYRTNTPNSSPPGAVQKSAPSAPGGPSVPFNNTPNLNSRVHGATVPLMAEYPNSGPAEVGPLRIDTMDTGPNSSGMRPLQGSASKR
jgi:hypothetical protein